MRFLLLGVGLGVLLWFGVRSSVGFREDRQNLESTLPATLSLTINDQYLGQLSAEQSTVGGFLAAQHLTLGTNDSVAPKAETPLFSGMHVIVRLARPVTIRVDGKQTTVFTAAKTGEEVLAEQRVVLDEDDMVDPGRAAVIVAGGSVKVTRVEIREEHKDTSIDFSTRVNEDSQLSWRTKKVTQKGEKGVRRTTYRVSYYDEKEVKRKVLSAETLKEPVTEVVTQGTYVKLGKSHRGAASWYAFTGTLAAANPWLPLGSYVKVTNLDNGKSVIVKINDRGPFVPGRIIDLDKVAFQQIASIGAGVINVKMEEVLN